MPAEEALFLFKILPGKQVFFIPLSFVEYYQYLKEFPNTLLTKFFGLYKMTWQKKETYFVIMANIFNTPLPIKEQYDLKGSTAGRFIDISGDSLFELALKDLNFSRKIVIGEELKKQFMEQVEKDCTVSLVFDYLLRSVSSGWKSGIFVTIVFWLEFLPSISPPLT